MLNYFPPSVCFISFKTVAYCIKFKIGYTVPPLLKKFHLSLMTLIISNLFEAWSSIFMKVPIPHFLPQNTEVRIKKQGPLYPPKRDYNLPQFKPPLWGGLGSFGKFFSEFWLLPLIQSGAEFFFMSIYWAILLPVKMLHIL